MRIAVDKIKENPTGIKEAISAKAWEMDSFDIKFAGDIQVDCKFVKYSNEIVSEALITLNRDITCSRCLDHSKQALKHNFKKSYHLADLGEYLDVNDDIREELLLNFPMKVLCKADCQGICSHCGVNLNHKECECQERAYLG